MAYHVLFGQKRQMVRELPEEHNGWRREEVRTNAVFTSERGVRQTERGLDKPEYERRAAHVTLFKSLFLPNYASAFHVEFIEGRSMQNKLITLR